MEQTAIFGPFLAMMLLTLVVWIYLYVRRIHFLTKNQIDSKTLTGPNALANISPPAVANPSDNLKNLFELPILFYALCLHLFATGQVDAPHLYAAWVFVGFRVLHSAVHSTFNLVMLRFSLYAISALALWLMLVRAVLAYLGG